VEDTGDTWGPYEKKNVLMDFNREHMGKCWKIDGKLVNDVY
jgi:hypothetical protein